MARKIIDRVTITGADDSVAPINLVRLAEEFPFVEFGILLSKRQMGGKRFPSLRWIMELNEIINRGTKPALSGHICGHWVRDICIGGGKFFEDVVCWRIFNRLQLNFHAEPHQINFPRFARVLRDAGAGQKQIILQVDGVNNSLFFSARKHTNACIVPLFDLSGGTGELPLKWPEALNNIYCGYAGGLSPENLNEQIAKIIQVVGNGPIWIDAETHLRSQDDRVFDLAKVRKFLEAAEPWVRNQK